MSSVITWRVTGTGLFCFTRGSTTASLSIAHQGATGWTDGPFASHGQARSVQAVQVHPAEDILDATRVSEGFGAAPCCAESTAEEHAGGAGVLDFSEVYTVLVAEEVPPALGHDHVYGDGLNAADRCGGQDGACDLSHRGGDSNAGRCSKPEALERSVVSLSAMSLMALVMLSSPFTNACAARSISL
ncbi:hypothetical protein [Streptomyces sp. NPDC054765]